MNTKSKIYIVVLACLILIVAGFFYFRISKFSIGADELLPDQKPTCKIEISGNVVLTHTEKNSDLKLLLSGGSRVLAETEPQEGKYRFIVEDFKPSGTWNIAARENLGGEILQYPVSEIQGLKCDSKNYINLEL